MLVWLYGFLALSFVRNKEQDVAAIAIYYWKDEVKSIRWRMSAIKSISIMPTRGHDSTKQILQKRSYSCTRLLQTLLSWGFQIVETIWWGLQNGDHELLISALPDFLNTSSDLVSRGTTELFETTRIRTCSLFQSRETYATVYKLSKTCLIGELQSLQPYNSSIVFPRDGYTRAQSSGARPIVSPAQSFTAPEFKVSLVDPLFSDRFEESRL